MQKCLIILGMHRSGTSSISGFLNKLGISLGSKLLIPNEYNERGYFENSYIVNANDNILQTLGSSWDDLFLFEDEWWQTPQLIPHRDVVKKIIQQEFSANELFCIKDPRISILLPFWISVLQELNIETFFIIPLRHPIEVAESLKTRDGFSIQKGLLLWMNNMLSIEYYSRPFRRSFFVFDEFLKSPADTIHRILNKFNIVFPNAESQIDTIAKEFLDPKVKHHNIKGLSFNGDMLSLTNRLNTILFNFNNNGELDKNVLIAVDEIRGEYKRLCSMFYNQDIRNAYLYFKATSAELNGHIAALYQSTSWRITWPLRIVGHQLKRFRRIGLRRRIACLFGTMYRQDGESKISQGFMGEELQIPGANVDNPLISVAKPVYNECRSDKKCFLMEEALSKNLREVLEVIQTRVITDSTYFGIPCQRSPLDFWIYQEIIFALKPDVIVEIGSYCGGSALSLAHLCDHLDKGRIITVDIDHSRLDQTARNHPRISFITGDACEVFDEVAAKCGESAVVMVIEDSSHEYQNTLNVLNKYSQLVTVGSYLIVEDGICHHGLNTGPDPGPYEAISEFIDNNHNFYIDRKKEAFLITWNPKGYLKREK